MQAEGGGWDPWPHEPCGVTHVHPRGHDAKKSGPEAWYRYKCLFYIKISQNGQLVVPRPLVKGWGWGGESLFQKATRTVVSHWAGAKRRAGGGTGLAPSLTACARMHTPCLSTRKRASGQGARFRLEKSRAGGEEGGAPSLAEYCIGDIQHPRGGDGGRAARVAQDAGLK